MRGQDGRGKREIEGTARRLGLTVKVRVWRGPPEAIYLHEARLVILARRRAALRSLDLADAICDYLRWLARR